MPRPNASGRDREICSRTSRKAAAAATTDAAEAAAPPEVTTASTMSALEEIRKKAMEKGHTAAAVSAVLAMARLAGLFKDKPERSPALPKFDGNYHEAARRIALLLRLGKEKPAKAEKKSMKRQADKARDRSS
jgi:peroxiredoxin family protein